MDSSKAEPQPCSSWSVPQRQEKAMTSDPEPGPSEAAKIMDFDFERKPHPLLLENVVRDVLDYINVEELKPFRLVSKGWNQEVCKLTRKKQTVTFVGSSAISKYMEVFSPEATLHVHSKFQLFGVNLFPHRIIDTFFSSYGQNIRTLMLEQKVIYENDLHRILQKFTPNLECLSLRCVPSPQLEKGPDSEFDSDTESELENPPCEEEMAAKESEAMSSQTSEETAMEGQKSEDVFDQEAEVPSYPQIRHLTIGRYCGDAFTQLEALHVGEQAAGTADYRQLVRFLTRLPNLQSLSVAKSFRMIPSPNNPEFSAILLRCLTEAGPGHFQNLTLIKFPVELRTDVEAQAFINLELLHLEELELVLLNPEVKSATLTSLISVVGGSLTKLSLVFKAGFLFDYNLVIPGRRLAYIRTLCLKRFKWSLAFLEQLPTLRSLTLVDMCLGPIFPIRGRALIPGLEVLKVVAGELWALMNDAEVVSRIGRAFPNLSVLHLPGLGDDCLGPVYMDLPYLVELNCTSGTFTDSGVSGVPLEILADLVQTQTFSGFNGDTIRRNLFIGNLTKLVRLTLESERMTDFSVLFGVICCPKLRILSLKSPLITDLGVESISNAMGGTIDSVNVLQCPGITDAGIFYANNMYAGRQFLVTQEPESSSFSQVRRTLIKECGFYDDYAQAGRNQRIHDLSHLIAEYWKNPSPARLKSVRAEIRDGSIDLSAENMETLWAELRRPREESSSDQVLTFNNSSAHL